MKKIIEEGVLEQAEHYCDKHPDRRCFSELKTISWYGSEFDMMGLELHLCDACMFDMYKTLQKEFQVEPKDIEL